MCVCMGVHAHTQHSHIHQIPHPPKKFLPQIVRRQSLDPERILPPDMLALGDPGVPFKGL